MDCLPSAPVPIPHNYDAPRVGHHQQPRADGYAYDNGELVGTITPDLAGDIDARNGWIEDGEVAASDHDRRFEDAADLLSPLLEWLSTGETLESIGRRTVVLIQMLRPEHLGARSLTQLAEHFGGTKQSLSKFNKELMLLCRDIIVRRHGARSPKVRRASSIAARRRHRAAGHEMHSGRVVDTVRARIVVGGILKKVDAQKACKPAKEE